ncbi:hypothetical protein SI65_04732 [Aspergillus cristatus]|uniref:Cytochrome P450 n=1 Tax=Aspergillus cristatus TaxID=573508 RepID=A0A1E3BH79_ASPCR|nr:hypothetical protein SI65_04732 [Aspergillus cristatus]
MAKNTAKSSFVERLFSADPSEDDIIYIKQTVVTLYAGGADSTAAGPSFFYLAMAVFPDVQNKARGKSTASLAPDGYLASRTVTNYLKSTR